MESATDPLIRSHVPEYLAEFIGTMLMVFVGLSVVVFNFGPGSPVARWIPDAGWRLLPTGLCFAATGSLIAVSPLGRLSGAHINPAVSFAFFLHRTMPLRDFLGYAAAQMLGGTAGAAMLAGVWKDRALAVHDGMTLVGARVPLWGAFALEAGLTGLLVALIFGFVSSKRLARYTPLMTWILVATMVWREAPFTGTSLNPARSFGPALIAGIWTRQWLYFAAPLSGGALGWAAYLALRAETTYIHTSKLFHAPGYRSLFRKEPNHPDRKAGEVNG